MFEKLLTRMQNEITAMKRLIRRSNQSVATKTIQQRVVMTADTQYAAYAEILVKNLSDAPMLLEVSMDISNFKQTYGDYLYGLSYQMAADKNNPKDRLLFVEIASATGAITVGQTFGVNLFLTATSDFSVEVVS